MRHIFYDARSGWDGMGCLCLKKIAILGGLAAGNNEANTHARTQHIPKERDISKPRGAYDDDHDDDASSSSTFFIIIPFCLVSMFLSVSFLSRAYLPCIIVVRAFGSDLFCTKLLGVLFCHLGIFFLRPRLFLSYALLVG